ncbi:hypothetical protein AOLI_G00292410 [Acnodon oligacanthus]
MLVSRYIPALPRYEIPEEKWHMLSLFSGIRSPERQAGLQTPGCCWKETSVSQRSLREQTQSHCWSSELVWDEGYTWPEVI